MNERPGQAIANWPAGAATREGARTSWRSPFAPRERASIPVLIEYGLLKSGGLSERAGLAVASTRCDVQFTRDRAWWTTRVAGGKRVPETRHGGVR